MASLPNNFNLLDSSILSFYFWYTHSPSSLFSVQGVVGVSSQVVSIYHFTISLLIIRVKKHLFQPHTQLTCHFQWNRVFIFFFFDFLSAKLTCSKVLNIILLTLRSYQKEFKQAYLAIFDKIVSRFYITCKV